MFNVEIFEMIIFAVIISFFGSLSLFVFAIHQIEVVNCCIYSKEKQLLNLGLDILKDMAGFVCVCCSILLMGMFLYFDWFASFVFLLLPAITLWQGVYHIFFGGD